MTFTLTRNQLRSLASMASFTSVNDVNPALECVSISIVGGQLTAVATDRYRGIRQTFTVEADTDLELAVPGRLLTSALKLFPATSVRGKLTVTMTADDDGTIVIGDGTETVYDMGCDPKSAPFAGVSRLVDVASKAEAATKPVVLNIKFLADLGRLWAVGGQKAEHWSFSLPKTVGTKLVPPAYAACGDFQVAIMTIVSNR
jgi:hypothetical protein